MKESWKKLQTHVKPEYFFWAAVISSIFFAFDAPPATLSKAVSAAAVEAFRENPYDALELSARAAYVYDVTREKALFAKNEREVVPLASITKIMTAATALSLVPDTTYVAIGQRAVAEEGDSGLRIGERWLLRDLLKFILLESSNDGAVAVSAAIGETLATSTATVDVDEHRDAFIRKMNELAETLHFSSTRFLNEDGLDIGPEQAGAYSSAAETALMLAYALETFPGVFEATRWNELTLSNQEGVARAVRNTNQGIDNFPLLIASKTGYTDLAGGNLVIAFNAGFNHPIIVSVLGSTLDGRFIDAEALVWATLDYLAQAR